MKVKTEQNCGDLHWYVDWQAITINYKVKSKQKTKGGIKNDMRSI